MWACATTLPLMDERYVVKNLFQDRFDYRRDLDQVFGRVSSGGLFDEAPPSATSAESLSAIASVRRKRQVPLSSVTPWRRSRNPGASRAGRTVTTRERKAKRSEKDVDFHYKEITCGSFERIFSLPEGVDTGKWKADYRNGVLELTAPVAAARPPRRIPANTAPMSKRIAA